MSAKSDLPVALRRIGARRDRQPRPQARRVARRIFLYIYIMSQSGRSVNTCLFRRNRIRTRASAPRSILQRSLCATEPPARHRPLTEIVTYLPLLDSYLSFYVQQGRNIVKNCCNDWGKRGLPPIPGENRAAIARLLLVCDKRDILLPNRQKKAKILVLNTCQTCS